MPAVNQLLAIGQSEILIIAVVALLLFGGAKLPELAKGLGESIREFKGAMEDEPQKTSAVAPPVAPASTPTVAATSEKSVTITPSETPADTQ